MDAGTEGAYASPVLDGGTVYAASDGLEGCHLFALAAATGEVRWKFPAPRQIFATPALSGGVLYMHVRDDGIYAIRAFDGARLWKTPTPAPQDEFGVFADLTKSSPAIAGEKVFVGAGRSLLALDRRTGKVLWRGNTGGKVDSSPLVIGGTVYVGSDDGRLYAFDAATGAAVWSFRTGGKISISPAAAGGMVLVGSNDGNLYALGAARK
jgi:outer membrane protein assembly factor BamB